MNETYHTREIDRNARRMQREFRAAGGYAWHEDSGWWASVRGVEPTRGRGKYEAMNAALEARAGA